MFSRCLKKRRLTPISATLKNVNWFPPRSPAWDKLDAAIKQNIIGRAEALTEAHRRIRKAVDMKVRGLTVKPQLPPDLLGLLVLQPFAGNS